LSNQGAYKFNSSAEIPVKQSAREDSRSTDKQPDKSSPEGIPDVGDRRARHVDALAIKPGEGYIKPRPE